MLVVCTIVNIAGSLFFHFHRVNAFAVVCAVFVSLSLSFVLGWGALP